MTAINKNFADAAHAKIGRRAIGIPKDIILDLRQSAIAISSATSAAISAAESSTSSLETEAIAYSFFATRPTLS